MKRYWATLGSAEPAFPEYNVAGKTKVYLATDVEAIKATLEARIVEVEWERDWEFSIGSHYHKKWQRADDRAERAEKEREDALDKASVEEAVGKVLGGQLNDAEKRLAEVVGALEVLSRKAKRFQDVSKAEDKKSWRQWDDLYEAIEKADAALAHAHEEEKK